MHREVSCKPDLVIVWRLTQRCNSNCHFCSYASALKGHRNNTSPSELLRFGEILGRYQIEFNKRVLLTWIGGEPLLWPHLGEVSQELKERNSLALGITTNGYLLGTKSAKDLLLSSYDEVTVSLDGLESFHDWARGEEGQYRRIVSNLRLFNNERVRLKRKIRLSVNTILMRRNIEHFEDLCHSLLDLGIDQLTFNQLGGIGRPEFYSENRLKPEQVEAFIAELPRIRREFASRKLNILGGNAYLKRISASTLGVKLPVEECNPGRNFLFVNEQGFISPCDGTTEEYGISSSEIVSPSDIQHLEERLRDKRKNFRSEKCLNCNCTQVHGKFKSVAEDQDAA